MLKRVDIKQKTLACLSLFLLFAGLIFFCPPVAVAQTMDGATTISNEKSPDELLADIKSILGRIEDRAASSGKWYSTSLLSSASKALRDFTTSKTSEEGYYNYDRWGKGIKNALKDAGKELDLAVKNGYITDDERIQLQRSLESLGTQAQKKQEELLQEKMDKKRDRLDNKSDDLDAEIAELERKLAAQEITQEEFDAELSKIRKKQEKLDKRQGSINRKQERKEEKIEKRVSQGMQSLNGCPTTAQYKARYSAGCWSCLVIEHLTSAFLNAANQGLFITQNAGRVLLLIGSVLWLAFWAFKNVSSFTQLQLGNLMNDLLKFGFKVMLAYWFINYSTTAIGQYFITPIMSVGTTIGQQFWDAETETYTQTAEDIESTDSLVAEIPDDIEYTGPTNIMSASVMDSLLGAVRAITNKTSEVMVLGNIIMCYASDGGAWDIKVFDLTIMTMTNIFTWVEGAVVWCLGFFLVLALSYYFIDISFKIGFAVLAFPVVMGLWPFDMTKGRLYVIISVIGKSAALFAFMAIMVHFGVMLVGEAIAVGGLDSLYEKLDTLALGTATEDQEDELREEINDTFSLFSTTFVVTLFALLYFYKMVQKTSSDLVNKFFPDGAFGDSSPMHSAATMMTSWAQKFTAKATGFDLAKDIVANQVGVVAKKGLRAAGGAVGGAARKGYQGAKRAIGKAGQNIGNRLRGK